MTLDIKLKKVLEDSELQADRYSDLKNIIEYASKSETVYDITELTNLVYDSYKTKYLPNRERTKQTNKETFEKLLELYINNSVKHSIDYWLSKKGMSIKELVEKTSLSKKGIYDIRKGISEPRFSTLVLIAEALEIPVYQLKENGGYRNRLYDEWNDWISAFVAF